MKTSLKRIPTNALFILLSGVVLAVMPTALFSQGSLTPPGAPVPTMKTLDQIEARTPISSAPYTISSSGSYYLTANLTVATGDAITITASGVTLDLNGFTISSTAPSANGTGILLEGNNNLCTDITIFNGHIRGSVRDDFGVFSGGGFANGISASSAFPFNVRVTAMSVQGCLNDGIQLFGAATLVESCTVHSCGGHGIAASSVSRSIAERCGNEAIFGFVASDCFGECIGGSAGIDTQTAINCHGTSIDGDGVIGKTLNNCFGASSGPGYGIFAASTANNCQGFSSSGIALYATIANSCFGQSGGPDEVAIIAEVAIGCDAVSEGQANIANSCIGNWTAPHKYNMP
jgi:hypothetical protein